jgi:stage V sporulation protein K
MIYLQNKIKIHVRASSFSTKYYVNEGFEFEIEPVLKHCCKCMISSIAYWKYFSDSSRIKVWFIDTDLKLTLYGKDEDLELISNHMVKQCKKQAKTDKSHIIVKEIRRNNQVFMNVFYFCIKDSKYISIIYKCNGKGSVDTIAKLLGFKIMENSIYCESFMFPNKQLICKKRKNENICANTASRPTPYNMTNNNGSFYPSYQQQSFQPNNYTQQPTNYNPLPLQQLQQLQQQRLQQLQQQQQQVKNNYIAPYQTQSNTYNRVIQTQPNTYNSTQQIQPNTYNSTQRIQPNTYNQTIQTQPNTYRLVQPTQPNTYNPAQQQPQNVYNAPYKPQLNTYNQVQQPQTNTYNQVQHPQTNTYNPAQQPQTNTYNQVQHQQSNTYNPVQQTQKPIYEGSYYQGRRIDVPDSSPPVTNYNYSTTIIHQPPNNYNNTNPVNLNQDSYRIADTKNITDITSTSNTTIKNVDDIKTNFINKKVINDKTIEDSFQVDKPITKNKSPVVEDPEKEIDNRLTVGELMQKEFKRIVGQEVIKDQLRKFYKKVLLDQYRKKKNDSKRLYHMIFSGPPGTGKTTMAKVVSKIMLKMKLVQNDKIVFVNNALELIGKYIGHTPGKVDEKVEEAKGGILFIDEAYSIVKENENASYGTEAIDTIMKHLDPPSCVFIFAGYEKPMEEFLKANAGMARRIPYRFDFKPYDKEELKSILEVMVIEKNETLHPELKEKFLNILSDVPQDLIDSQNAGLISNWLSFAQLERDDRVSIDEAKKNPTILHTLTLHDFESALPKILKMK